MRKNEEVIYNGLIPFRGFAAINLFGFIFAREECKPLSKCTLNHEAIHTAQMRELLYVVFYLWYLLEWLVKLPFYGKAAYRNISFEREAYRHAGYEGYLSIRRRYRWIHLITNKK